jgi:hypothetical protein
MSNYAGQASYGLHAVCNFDADAAAPVFRNQRGFTGAAGVTRNGAGDYTLTLSDGIAQAQSCIVANTNAGAASIIDAQWVTATTIRIRTTTSGAVATDLDFSVVIHDMGPN